jgi:hypothetical protein
VLVTVPAHKEYTLRYVEQRNAVTVAIDPAFAVLLGRDWLHVLLQTVPINAVKVVRKLRIEAILTTTFSCLTSYCSCLASFNYRGDQCNDRIGATIAGTSNSVNCTRLQHPTTPLI